MTHPGRQVKQKSCLNRAILDQGSGEFRLQRAYKQAWRGGRLSVAEPHDTSQTCPACLHVEAGNHRSQATFRCLACGFEEHADVVGACNVLARGLREIACEAKAQSGRAMKREPARNIQMPT